MCKNTFLFSCVVTSRILLQTRDITISPMKPHRHYTLCDSDLGIHNLPNRNGQSCTCVNRFLTTKLSTSLPAITLSYHFDHTSVLICYRSDKYNRYRKSSLSLVFTGYQQFSVVINGSQWLPVVLNG